jgi:hypothetical protein
MVRSMSLGKYTKRLTPVCFTTMAGSFVLGTGGHNRQNRIVYRRDGKEKFGAGNPVRVLKTIEDGVSAFDAREKSVSSRGLGSAGILNAENIGDSEIGAAFILLCVHAGFKRGEKGTAARDEIAELLALGVTEQRDIRQEQDIVVLEVIGGEIVFMHEVEWESAFEQRVVEALHGLGAVSFSRGLIKQLGSLSHHDCDICHRALVFEMAVVSRKPIEEFASRFLPSAIRP